MAEGALTRVRLSRCVRPLSEFRAKIGVFLEQARTSEEPMILTHHGHAAAVLIGVEAYERLLDELELLRDVRAAEAQMADAPTGALEHARVETRLRAMSGR